MYKHIHMVGIGGIGMSALAQLYRARKAFVRGSDRSPGPTSELLESKDIEVLFGHASSNVSPEADLLVYSDAVPLDNPERAHARKLGVKELNYFEALGEVSEKMKTIAIAGTHGKTTTTAMLVKILTALDIDPTGIIGSIVRDFGSNYVEGDPNLLVVEACEYRDHLLELHPEVLVINNLEWDHSDYFASLETLQETFRKAIAEIPENGVIITDPKHPNIAPILGSAKCRILDYTMTECPPLPLIGEFNISNARAAITAALAILPDADRDKIAKALAEFKGTWRRFEYKGSNANGALVYDDYAHHPTAVRVTIEGVRKEFPEKKLVIAFHPHLYSRTRDFMNDFASSLSLSDEVILAPIYPAREEPIDGVTSEVLAKLIEGNNTKCTVIDTFDKIESVLSHCDSNTVIITMGAGDIYKVADAITKK